MPIRWSHPLSVATALSGSLVLVTAAPAAAAPEFEDGVVEAGQGRQVVVIQNRFGCDGVPTEGFDVTIPEGVIDVTPRANAGWTIEREIVPSDPYELFGATQTERTGTLRWSGSVADDEFAEFAFMALFGDEPTTYAFPVTQVCADGREIRWDEVAGDGQDAADLGQPAPVLQVVEPPPDIDVVALSTSVDELSSRADGLAERLDALEQRVGEIVTDAGDVRVPALRQQVSDLRDAVDELRAQVQELADGQG
jgi:uncharacterized protein YcnI